jgi:hypothetical protein
MQTRSIHTLMSSCRRSAVIALAAVLPTVAANGDVLFTSRPAR